MRIRETRRGRAHSLCAFSMMRKVAVIAKFKKHPSTESPSRFNARNPSDDYRA